MSRRPYIYKSTKNDEWMSPNHIWDTVLQYTPIDKKIWEPFYSPDSTSGDYMISKGYDVIWRKEDFFEVDYPDRIIITNPPFSKKKQILEKLFNNDYAFMILLPMNCLFRVYFQKYLDKVQIIIPNRRINFIKKDLGLQKNINLECVWICHKMNLPKDINLGL